LVFLAIGNNEANEGNYGTAIEYFTQAISLHNRDFRLVEESKVFLNYLVCNVYHTTIISYLRLSILRFFGNRSYCYDRLGEYSKALQDAEVTIMLVPHWAKGYFRKGRALAGLKVHIYCMGLFTWAGLRG
jgi:tetratricopeptide (TPR) repeat protein